MADTNREKYEIEEIVDFKNGTGGPQYLIKWKGYGEEDNSWAPPEDIHSIALRLAFHQKLFDRRRRARRSRSAGGSRSQPVEPRRRSRSLELWSPPQLKSPLVWDVDVDNIKLIGRRNAGNIKVYLVKHKLYKTPYERIESELPKFIKEKLKFDYERDAVDAGKESRNRARKRKNDAELAARKAATAKRRRALMAAVRNTNALSSSPRPDVFLENPRSETPPPDTRVKKIDGFQNWKQDNEVFYVRLSDNTPKRVRGSFFRTMPGYKELFIAFAEKKMILVKTTEEPAK